MAAVQPWLQPIATVVAGLLALTGALIAFKAVTRQIEAAAEQHTKNRDAEWARLRRSELLDVLLEAARVARQLAGVATNYEIRIENSELFRELDDQPLEEQLKKLADDFYALEARVLVEKLKLLGADEVSGALEVVVQEASDVINQVHRPEWTIYENEEAVIAAIRDLLKQPE